MDHLRSGDAARPILEVPAGTTVHVRLKERITDRNRAGDVFVGRLERDITRGRKVLAPHGSRVVGRIVHLGEGSRQSSSTEVSLVLEQMVVGKKAHPLETLALSLSVPAGMPSAEANSMSLRGPGLPDADESCGDPGATSPETTIHEPNTRLTFVLAERLWLPVFVPAD